jgi:signal peptidase
MSEAAAVTKAVFAVGARLTFVGIVVTVAVFAVPQLAGADHSYAVVSSSMAPTLHTGDAILVNEVEPRRIETGDVITFESAASHGVTDSDRVTHRVVEIDTDEHGRSFKTKGDAN